MTTPLVILVVFVVSLILLIGGVRRFVLMAGYVAMQALIWLVQQIGLLIYGTAVAAPGFMVRIATALRNAARTATGPIVRVLTWLGWILVVLVLVTAVGIGSGNTLALTAIAIVLGTIAYLLHRGAWLFNSTRFAVTALVLYGLAVAGLLFPSTVRIHPRFVVVVLLLWAMLGIVRRLASQRQTTAAGTSVPTRIAIWAGRVLRTAMVLIIVAVVAVLVGTQIGVIDLQLGRMLFSNKAVNNQADAEADFHQTAETALDNTVRGIYHTLGNEMNSGAPNAAAADSDFVKLEQQQAVLDRAYEADPVPETGFGFEVSQKVWLFLAIAAMATMFVFRGRRSS